MTHGMQSLVDLATNKCIQNIARLNDVGATPFHLLRPVLERMNAKQLAHIESLSPQLVPHTDVLWPLLIERDFPDRPIYAGRRALTSRADAAAAAAAAGAHADAMPNKTLYYRYNGERELFRQDSARRLRSITERLKQEKEAKSIVAVLELLRDPTVRRRTYNAAAGRGGLWGPKRNTIIGRARRDLRNRPLMFPEKGAAYDPYEAFYKRTEAVAPSSRPVRNRPPTAFNTTETRQPVLVSTERPGAGHQVTIDKPLRPAATPASPDKPQRPATVPDAPVILPPRKHRPPSIFLARKRKQPIRPKPEPVEAPPLPTPALPPPRTRRIRSSIFN